MPVLGSWEREIDGLCGVFIVSAIYLRDSIDSMGTGDWVESRGYGHNFRERPLLKLQKNLSGRKRHLFVAFHYYYFMILMMVKGMKDLFIRCEAPTHAFGNCR